MSGPEFGVSEQVQQKVLAMFSKAVEVMRRLKLPFVFMACLKNSEDHSMLVGSINSVEDEDGDPWFPTPMMAIAFLVREPKASVWAMQRMQEVVKRDFNGSIEDWLSTLEADGDYHIRTGLFDKPEELGSIEAEMNKSHEDKQQADDERLRPYKDFLDSIGDP